LKKINIVIIILIVAVILNKLVQKWCFFLWFRF